MYGTEVVFLHENTLKILLHQSVHPKSRAAHSKVSSGPGVPGGIVTQKINGSLPAIGCQLSQAPLTRDVVPRPVSTMTKLFLSPLCKRHNPLMPMDHILEFPREQGKCGKKGKGNPLFHNGANRHVRRITSTCSTCEI